MGLKWLLLENAPGAAAPTLHKNWIHSDIASPPQHGERIAALAAADCGVSRRSPRTNRHRAEGRTALRMTLACYRAAELGRRVAINEVK